jgi:hypothetical protein
MGKADESPLVDRSWTEDEVALLVSHYSQQVVMLELLASKIGRDKANICRKARALGLTDVRRPKKLQLSINYNPPPSTQEESAKRRSESQMARIRRDGHPRFMLGRKHSETSKLAMAEASREMWADPSSKVNTPEQTQRRSDEMYRRIKSGKMRRGYSRGLMGRRSDLGDQHFRSSWEANYARFLNWRITRGEVLSWEFEKHRFEFEAIRFGTRSYLPDFKVVMPDGKHEWHEVKGWMDRKSATKLKRMAKYFPEEKVVVIGADWFRAAKRSGLSAMVGGWE